MLFHEIRPGVDYEALAKRVEDMKYLTVEKRNTVVTEIENRLATALRDWSEWTKPSDQSNKQLGRAAAAPVVLQKTDELCKKVQQTATAVREANSAGAACDAQKLAACRSQVEQIQQVAKPVLDDLAQLIAVGHEALPGAPVMTQFETLFLHRARLDLEQIVKDTDEQFTKVMEYTEGFCDRALSDDEWRCHVQAPMKFDLEELVFEPILFWPKPLEWCEEVLQEINGDAGQ